MKKYCMDMSGLSNPIQDMPEDIYPTLWGQVTVIIEAGQLAVTKEIYEEMTHIPGALGTCIKANEASLLLEVGDDSWDWASYLDHAKRMQEQYAAFLSENNGGSKATICINDLSIIALGRALKLPVISMEKPKAHQSETKRKIPDICAAETVPHMTFNDFLRAEGISI